MGRGRAARSGHEVCGLLRQRLGAVRQAGRRYGKHSGGHRAHLPGDDEIRRITNGRISCEVNCGGVLSFFCDGTLILREHFRNYEGTISRQSRCLKVEGRTCKAHVGGDWRIVQKFEATDGEKIFGMGQYQQVQTNLKGCVLDLEQRNSQISVPFAVSNLGYGFVLAGQRRARLRRL